MANRLIIDGKDITEDVRNFDDFEIEIELNPSTKTIVKTLSQSISIYGDAFESMKKTFFDGCNGMDHSKKVIFKTDICGGISMPLIITAEGMELFDDHLKVELKTDTDEEEAYSYLETTYWFEEGFPQAYEIPIVFYVDQPNWLQWLIILLTLQIRVLLNILDTTLKTICEAASLTLGKCNINLSGLVFSKLDTWLTGTGRWATAPLLREILSYHAGKTGLTFVSSILNDAGSAYYNTAMFHIDRGFRGDYKDISKAKRLTVLTENANLLTVTELLESLKSTFPGTDYLLVGGVMYFEKKSFFQELLNIKLFDTKGKCDVSYTYNTNDFFAYGEYKFSQDAYDVEGNKTMGLYNQKLEFNNPYSPAQKGKKTFHAPFGTARFMFDHLSYARTGFFDWELLIDDFRDGPETFIDTFVSTDGLQRKYDLILSGNMLSVPKLLVLENNFNRNDAHVVKKSFQKRNGNQFWLYNFPMLYKESTDFTVNNTFVPGIPGMMTNQFAIFTDPREQSDKMRISGIEIDCDCDVVKATMDHFNEMYIQTPYGKAVADSVKIQFQQSKITIKLEDIRVFCSS